ncbi:MAG: YbbR-like domain-containing protein [Algibacter sp.]
MIKKLKTEVSKSIKNRRIHVFFLFLTLAFIILIFSKLSKEHTDTLVFGINKINVPPENVILNDSNASLKITLKTHGFKWLKYYLANPKITIDFAKDVDNKHGTYIWSKSKAYLYESSQFGDQVKLLNIAPDTLLFKYDVNLVKKVPIIFNSNIKFTQGFDIDNTYKLTPDSIEVIGPHALASKIKSIETEDITLDNVKSDISEKIILKLPQEDGNLIFSHQTVLLSANVKKFTEGTFKVPVTLVNVPNGVALKYFPKVVNVTYYTSLDDFKTISSNDFIVKCDYNKVVNNQSFLTPELVKFPKRVKHVKVSQQRIEFIILK